MKEVIIYYLCINLIGFILFGYDKRQALQHKWRIRERNLFLAALLGGAPGATVGMYLFRHKTQKTKFVIGIPLMLVSHAGLVYFGLQFIPGISN